MCQYPPDWGGAVYHDAERLEKLDTIDALWSGIVNTLQARGIRHVIYITARGTPPRDGAVMSTCPDLYAGVATERDPFLKYCCHSYDATATGTEFLTNHAYLPDDAKAFIRKARELGFLSGIGIPTRIRGAERYGGFNLGTDLDRETFLAQVWPKAEEFRLFCLIMHRRIEELSGALTEDHPARATPHLPPQFDTLSPREAEVITLLARGLSRKEAARHCGISQHTVAEYAKSAYRKLGIHNRAEAARLVFGADAQD